jgi:hypothetical protein
MSALPLLRAFLTRNTSTGTGLAVIDTDKLPHVKSITVVH